MNWWTFVKELHAGYFRLIVDGGVDDLVEGATGEPAGHTSPIGAADGGGGGGGGRFVVDPGGGGGGGDRMPYSPPSTLSIGNLSELTIKCDPKVHITVSDSRIEKALELMGTSSKDIEWQAKFAYTKYNTPRHDPSGSDRVFDVALWRVDDVHIFDDYLLRELEQPSPQYWIYADYVTKILKRPPIWVGKVSRSKPITLSLPKGYYVLGTPDADERLGEDYGFSEWWVSDLVSNGSTWKAWKDFWRRGAKVTAFYRFRHHRKVEGALWYRLLNVDKAREGFTYKPRYEWKYQDFGQVPKSWSDKIAAWAEKQAENMWSMFKDMFS